MNSLDGNWFYIDHLENDGKVNQCVFCVAITTALSYVIRQENESHVVNVQFKMFYIMFWLAQKEIHDANPIEYLVSLGNGNLSSVKG